MLPSELISSNQKSIHKEQQIHQLLDHLFRHESGRLVAVLTRIFGSENLDLAEDVVQDSLLEAIKHWMYKGIPDNPSAWLFRVAKNKALNIVNHKKYKRKYDSDVVHLLQSEWTAEPAVDHFFSEKEIADDQLRMMFTCCHPSISTDSQVALTLRTLCGFSISEIARAFLTSEENINKRLVRARHKIRESKIPFEVPGSNELEQRLQTVLQSIYLIFNEGYSASGGSDLIRFETCLEAMRLLEMIESHLSLQDKSDVYALLALMQLNASRFGARQDAQGNILTLEQQDRSLWNLALMEKGFTNLVRSLANGNLSVYHLMASISAIHCFSPSYEATDWEGILDLYNKLKALDDSPLVLLNRAVAISKVHGANEAMAELEKLKTTPSLLSYHLFHSVLAELYTSLGDFAQAAASLETAIALAPLEMERVFLRKKLQSCHQKIK